MDGGPYHIRTIFIRASNITIYIGSAKTGICAGTYKIYPSKKVTQHDFDRLYLFYPGFDLFITLDIPGKPVYLPFDWCLICSDCFTEACVGWENWGQCQKGRVAKFIGFYGKCVLCHVSCRSFCERICTRAHWHCARAYIHCTKILRNETSCWI